MKKQPDLCAVNSYFDIGLNAWETSVDIQPVVNDYRALAFMCQYFTKTKEQCSQAIKQRVNETFESTIFHLDTIKIIPKVCISNRKCSVQKILLELKVRKFFLAVY